MAYNPDLYGFRNIVNTAVTVGSTAVKLTGLSAGQKRSAIQVSAMTQDVYLKAVKAGAAAPTISACALASSSVEGMTICNARTARIAPSMKSVANFLTHRGQVDGSRSFTVPPMDA